MKTKPFTIPKSLVWTAYKLVKANAGAAGIDRQSIEEFEKDLKNRLYKIWNRMSSGSYFPPPVMAVPIPKKTGGNRILGIPTVSDRIAQMVVKLQFEPCVEPYFLPDSYGYRPQKSALDAVGITRKRCWQYSWVLEFDIKGLFDNIPHDLMMKAVRKHTDISWVVLYIERWLMAPMQYEDGKQIARTCGTPQGGVISPVLSNLFLHYVFDKWMQIHYPSLPWCRYADDGLVHCLNESQALNIRHELEQRFAECGLELHPVKTKIVYCKDENRKGDHSTTSFDFLGYTFKARLSQNTAKDCLFVGFNPAVSKSALKSIKSQIRKSGVRNRTDLELVEIAKWFNPRLKGWLNYYGRYCKSAMYKLCDHFNKTLVAWAMKKYKHLQGKKTRTAKLLRKLAESRPYMFTHWRQGMIGGFV